MAPRYGVKPFVLPRDEDIFALEQSCNVDGGGAEYEPIETRETPEMSRTLRARGAYQGIQDECCHSGNNNSKGA